MEPLTLADLFPNDEHTENRDVWRKRIIALRNARRVFIGPDMTGSFENRETVHWQIQEMCRVEKIADDDGRGHELETYNPLIPPRGWLSMTLMIEIEDAERRSAMLHALRGVEHHVFLEVGGERMPAQSEIHEDDAPKAPAVHFLKFELSPDQVEAFCGGAEAKVLVDHDAYRREVAIEGGLREALAEEILT
ncbi:MAG: DUF3501 family protein [Planctomycetota bacterium]